MHLPTHSPCNSLSPPPRPLYIAISHIARVFYYTPQCGGWGALQTAANRGKQADHQIHRKITNPKKVVIGHFRSFNLL
jgi:hypothetical protein